MPRLHHDVLWYPTVVYVLWRWLVRTGEAFSSTFSSTDASPRTSTVNFNFPKVPSGSVMDQGYILEKKIGDGSFGKVYQGYDKTEKRPVAIKIIDLEKVEDELEDIQQEIRVLSDCDCGQLCRYFGSFIVESRLWIIMELVEYPTLKILAALGPLDENYICVILHELLLGLEYLHRERKIHRDIKAANVLCSKSGAIKLADFGVTGQLTDSVSKRQTFVGTPYWMVSDLDV
jgi:serine/threonine-protein kinase 24/25/MST4